MTRVGILGLSHDHVWSNVRQLAEQDGALVACASEPDAGLRQRFESEHPGVVLHETHAALLREAGSLDAVYLFSDNRESAKLGIEAASLGLHCLVEKPMAADWDGARRFLAAIEDNGVTAMVNWPFAWWPQLQRALSLVEEGAIGRLWQVSYRAAHRGPAEIGCSSQFVEWLYDPHRNGAGAYMDYCCYGAVLAHALLGEPARVTGLAGTLVKEDLPVEDNAMLVMEYANALATAQGSWTHIGSIGTYQTALLGEAGTILVGPEHGGSLQLATLDDPQGHPVEVPEPPEHLRSSAAHFLWLLGRGGPIHPLCDPRHGMLAQRTLERGLEGIKKTGPIGGNPG